VEHNPENSEFAGIASSRFLEPPPQPSSSDKALEGKLVYVLITPARNEAQFIEQTIESVIAQTVRPLKWIIVSDGSTDATDAIVSRYALTNSWIELVRMPVREERHFAGKVLAFNAGYARLRSAPYDVIVSLDADISIPDRDYFEFLLRKLVDDPALGLVGTAFQENSASYDYRIVGVEHVSGACQVFRRKCFEDIGGYVPVKGGGIDHIAVISARMKGWTTRTFTTKSCLHHRAMGTAEHSVLVARFRSGAKDYAFGGHPLWEFFRMLYQISRKPYVVGGLLVGAGFAWATARRLERPISREMVEFRRRDQMRRLRGILVGALSSCLTYVCWWRPNSPFLARGQCRSNSKTT